MVLPVFSRSALPRSYLLFWSTLLLIAIAEFMTAVVQSQVGVTLHALLLLGLMICTAQARREEDRRLALALVLMPIIRLLSLALPLPRLPQMAWYPVIAIPLLIATYMIVRQLGVSRRDLGLRLGVVPLQLALALGGVGIGALEYLILWPQPQSAHFSWSVFLLSSLSLVLFTGFSEELIFRALIQRLALPALGRWGLIYVSLLFGVMHIGYLSVADVLFVSAIGLLFAQLGRWSGSIFGITLAHGMSIIMLFLIMPRLAAQAPAALAPLVAAMMLIGALALVIVGGVLKLQFSAPPQPAPTAHHQLRELRRGQRIQLSDLAARTGLPSRRVAEIELGLAIPQLAELQLITIALGQRAEHHLEEDDDFNCHDDDCHHSELGRGRLADLDRDPGADYLADPEGDHHRIAGRLG
jgi:membrane protease YdiL (CAAX protease family)/transcriptional regulator with XRE-family HTH domain